MKTPVLLLSTLSLSALAAEPTAVNTQITDSVTQNNQAAQLDTVNVTADFRQLDLMQIPSSITVVGEDDIKNRNADHLESVLSLAPNVNFASGASRGRYFQIRGIGERSQFIDPVNPSVGLIIDGIDMTGLGGAATLFDIEQVEILRGPQGTAFGANALAGAINIKSKQPTKETEGYVQGKIGNYNTQGLGGAISGSLTDNLQARFAINQIKSDGYMENIHLNRDDTNNIDEVVARAQVAWQINESNDLNISLLKTDINNGYDAFSLDNNRNTYSDQPGEDSQDTTAASVKFASRYNQNFTLEVTVSSSNSDIVYAYDDDWSFGEYDEDNSGDCISPNNNCLETASGSYGYSAYDEYSRTYKRSNIDIRLISTTNSRIFKDSTSWILGVYNLDRDETLTRNYKYLATTFDSTLKQNSVAAYGELTTQISNTSSIKYGLRAEEWSNEYQNSNSLKSSESDYLWGGKVTLESLISPNHLTYVSLSRGYKAGGVNSNTDINESKRSFEAEINNTVETGLKSSFFEDELTTQLAIFYIQRKEQQVKSSYSKETTPPSFQEFIANAAEGKNYGLELESKWNLNKYLTWTASAGYLKTEFTDYKYIDEDNNLVNKDNRAQAHSPEYSFASSLNIDFGNSLSFEIEAEAKDSFYFSDSHDKQSDSYELIHASIQYTLTNLELSLNGHNLTNEDYAVRGFFFGNDPRFDANNENYTPTNYVQYGSPRLVSLTAQYNF